MAQTPADTYRQDKTLRLAKHILHPTPCEWGSCKAILNSLHALEKVCNNGYSITAISLGPAFLYINHAGIRAVACLGATTGSMYVLGNIH